MRRQDLVGPLHQPGQHQLLEHGCAEVQPHPGLGQRVHPPVRCAQPAQPQPAPERLAGAADGDRVRGVRRERARHRLALERQCLVGLVHDGHGAGPPQVGGVLHPLLVGHHVTGRVLEVGDQVGQPRRGLPQRRADGVEVPALGVDRAAGDPGAPLADRLRRVRVDRRLHQHPLARTGQRLRDDRGRRQSARRHHDLVGVGRQPAGVVRRGDGLLQPGEPGGEVAVPAEVRRQLGRGLGVRRREPGRRGGGRAVQVDRLVVAGAGEQRAVVGPGPPAGHPGEGARAAAGLGVPAVAELGVRPGDRGAGDTERVGELALAGQPGVEGDPAVTDQQPERLGEPGVRRGAVEVTDQSGHARGVDRTDHAGHFRTIGYLFQGQSCPDWSA